MANQPRRHPADHCIGRHVLRHHRSRGDHGVLPNRHAGKDGGIGSHPHILFQHDGSRVGRFPVFRCHPVVERGKHHIMPYLATVADRYAAMILKMATIVDKHMLAHRDVFPEIGIQRRKHAQSRRHRLPKKPALL